MMIRSSDLDDKLRYRFHVEFNYHTLMINMNKLVKHFINIDNNNFILGMCRAIAVLTNILYCAICNAEVLFERV